MAGTLTVVDVVVIRLQFESQSRYAGAFGASLESVGQGVMVCADR